MWCASPPHNPHPAPIAPLADQRGREGWGWSAFDWAKHRLKQEHGINEDDICVSWVWR